MHGHLVRRERTRNSNPKKTVTALPSGALSAKSQPPFLLEGVDEPLGAGAALAVSIGGGLDGAGVALAEAATLAATAGPASAGGGGAVASEEVVSVLGAALALGGESGTHSPNPD
jgi:hypothetical protein